MPHTFRTLCGRSSIHTAVSVFVSSDRSQNAKPVDTKHLNTRSVTAHTYRLFIGCQLPPELLFSSTSLTLVGPPALCA